MQEICVVIVDDDFFVCLVLLYFVLCDLEIIVIVQVEDGVEVISMVECEQLDVVMMDVQMLEMDGIEVIGVIVECWFYVWVFVVMMFDGSDIVLFMFSVGVFGYLFKDLSVEEIVMGVWEVYSGVSLFLFCIVFMFIWYVCDLMLVVIEVEFFELFMECEVEVFQCLVQGMLNVEIVKMLIVLEGIVKVYFGCMMVKWYLCDCVQILVMVVYVGFVFFC